MSARRMTGALHVTWPEEAIRLGGSAAMDASGFNQNSLEALTRSCAIEAPGPGCPATRALATNPIMN